MHPALTQCLFMSLGRLHSRCFLICSSRELHLSARRSTNLAPSIAPEESHIIGRKKPQILLDSHNRVHNYLRISLTERCSFRCQYCMPDEGVPLTPQPDLLTTAELLRLIGIFAGLGVTAIRLTGGEPLLRKDLLQIVRDVRKRHPEIRKIGITTNGLVLERNLDELVEAGVTHLNISLDSLIPHKFEKVTRRKGFDKVLRAIFSAQARLPTKVNCVVMRGFNEDEVPAFVELTRDQDLEVRFIEYMPFDGNRWSFEKLVPQKELEMRIQQSVPNITPLPLDPHHTAKLFTSPAHRGRWGFISSMSQAFCSTCNRLRLTADGALRSCLFSSRSDELSLRDLLRGPLDSHGSRSASAQPGNTCRTLESTSMTTEIDELLRVKIRDHLQKKHFSHGGRNVRDLASNDNRPMITIGG